MFPECWGEGAPVSGFSKTRALWIFWNSACRTGPPVMSFLAVPELGARLCLAWSWASPPTSLYTGDMFSCSPTKERKQWAADCCLWASRFRFSSLPASQAPCLYFCWGRWTPGTWPLALCPSAGPVVKEMTRLDSELRKPIFLSKFIFTLCCLPLSVPPSWPFPFFFSTYCMQPLKEWWSFLKLWQNCVCVCLQDFCCFLGYSRCSIYFARDIPREIPDYWYLSLSHLAQEAHCGLWHHLHRLSTAVKFSDQTW